MVDLRSNTDFLGCLDPSPRDLSFLDELGQLLNLCLGGHVDIFVSDTDNHAPEDWRIRLWMRTFKITTQNDILANITPSQWIYNKFTGDLRSPALPLSPAWWFHPSEENHWGLLSAQQDWLHPEAERTSTHSDDDTALNYASKACPTKMHACVRDLPEQ